MYVKWLPLLLLSVLTTTTAAMAQPTNQADLLREFKRRAAKFNCLITVPQFEVSTNSIRAAVRTTIAVGDAALDRIGALKPREATFENTVRALDDVGYQISLTDDRLSLLKEVSTSAALRDAATQALKHAINRPRPSAGIAGFDVLVENPDAFSFPSGHAAGAYAAATVLGGGGGARSALLATGALGIAVSRAYLGAHYPIDVLVGAVIGAGSGLFVRWAADG